MTAHDDEPQTLEDAARQELAMLWSDLTNARRSALNGVWSIRCENVAYRIVMLSRFVGPTSWQDVDVDLLLDGVYAKVYDEAGIDYPPIDWDRVREVKDRIMQRLGRRP